MSHFFILVAYLTFLARDKAPQALIEFLFFNIVLVYSWLISYREKHHFFLFLFHSSHPVSSGLFLG